MTSGEGSKIVRETHTIRRIRRKGGAHVSFFPLGLAPLVGLPLLLIFGWGPFAFASIQSDTEEAARSALMRVGATWATPHVSGQWVEIAGVAPSKEEADRAVAAVRAEKIQTLFGEAAPATRVTRRAPLASEPVAPPPSPPAAAEPAPAQPAPAQPAPAEPAAPAAPPTPTLADPTPPMQTCGQIMADVLGRTHIEFDRSSAAINASSKDILDDIAKAAASCPGGMRIAGHTDNRGSAELNASLSRRRAEAVREALISRGIAAERLIAAGLGPDKPVADNATDEGRARNRRIEITLIPPT
jgi:outer membrane protein OmpA-like peptidoglycan-associated protein